jgi:O-antigen/teichoic acid export membrane protein
MGIANIVGNVLGGWLLEIGGQMTFTVSGIITTVAIIVCIVWLKCKDLPLLTVLKV